MKNLKEFKEEFRLICCDTWGDAMDAWFEVAGRMHVKKMKIPDEWQYRPAPGGNPCNKESQFYIEFRYANAATLREIGNFLFRYCQLLKHFGKDY